MDPRQGKEELPRSFVCSAKREERASFGEPCFRGGGDEQGKLFRPSRGGRVGVPRGGGRGRHLPRLDRCDIHRLVAEHDEDLRDALDQAMNTLCGSVIFAGRNSDCVPDTAVVALETARILALERRPYGEASRVAVRRCGTDEESIVRWAEEFVEGFYGRR